MSVDVDRYPLHWPHDQPRTASAARVRSRYEVTQDRAHRDLLHELELMDARHVVISTNVALRRDGLPYSGRRSPDDPGVAVYWTTPSKADVCLACDQYESVRENMRAVGLSVAALRAIERAGATQILERAYRGFTALPAATITPPPRAWWRVLGFEEQQRITLERAKARYRELSRVRHPDQGGTHEAMSELNRAFDEAKAALS